MTKMANKLRKVKCVQEEQSEDGDHPKRGRGRSKKVKALVVQTNKRGRPPKIRTQNGLRRSRRRTETPNRYGQNCFCCSTSVCQKTGIRKRTPKKKRTDKEVTIHLNNWKKTSYEHIGKVDDNVYIVQNILRHSYNPVTKQTLFLVKWYKWSSYYNSWLCKDAFHDSEMVQEYWDEYKVSLDIANSSFENEKNMHEWKILQGNLDDDDAEHYEANRELEDIDEGSEEENEREPEEENESEPEEEKEAEPEVNAELVSVYTTPDVENCLSASAPNDNTAQKPMLKENTVPDANNNLRCTFNDNLSDILDADSYDYVLEEITDMLNSDDEVIDIINILN